jgi:hypothetical protein
MNQIERVFDRQQFEEMLRKDEEAGDFTVYRAPDGEHVVITMLHPDGSATTNTRRTLSSAEVQALEKLPVTNARPRR